MPTKPPTTTPPFPYPEPKHPLTHYELELGNPSNNYAKRLALAASTQSGQFQFRSFVSPLPPSSHITTTLNKHSSSKHPTTGSSSAERLDHLYRVPEDGDSMDFPTIPPSQSCSRDLTVNPEDDSGSRRINAMGVNYSSTGYGQPMLTERGGVEGDEDEYDSVLDEELAQQGLYRGSYRQLVALYTLTPIFTLLVFIFLAYLPSIAYPLSPDTLPGAPHPYASYFPFPLPEFVTAAAFWAISHLLNASLFSLFSTLFSSSSSSFLSLSLTTLAQSAITIILRQIVMPILLIPRHAVHDHPTWHDVTFRRVWWVALGWAAAEAIVGINQGYEGIALYQNVLVTIKRVVSSSPPSNNHKQGVSSTTRSRTTSRGNSSPEVLQYPFPRPTEEDAERQPLLDRRSSVASGIATRSPAQLRNAIEEEVERDIDELISLRAREELEDLYGMPFIHIPVFISCLHRLNSVLFILGSTLFLTAAYMRSTLSIQPSHTSSSKNNTPLVVSFTITLLLQWLLALLHTPRVLPRIGVQTFVFIGVMIGLGVFFGGLGVWEGIV